MTAQHALSQLATDIEHAQSALMERARATPEEWLDPRELRNAASNGWTGDVMMYALTDLVNRGALAVDERLCVKLAKSD